MSEDGQPIDAPKKLPVIAESEEKFPPPPGHTDLRKIDDVDVVWD